MSTALWVLQAVLAVKFLSTAWTHGLRHNQERMALAIQRMGRPARPLLRGVAALTLVGAIGLIVPAAFGVLTWVTPAAAVLLAAMMPASIVLHLRCREKPLIAADVVLLALAAFVAVGRWVLAPL